jgi:oligopeptide/dipeptide ABC transporter ATP-binding protein
LCDQSNIIEVNNLKKYYEAPQKGLFEPNKKLKVVDDISFSIKEGEVFGLVGESGCGKSTTAKLLLKLIEQTSGDIKFQGTSINSIKKRDLRKLRSKMQIVFQDPYSSLNPRKKIGWLLEEPLKIQKILNKPQRKEKVLEMLDLIGFDKSFLSRYPHEISGGQRQRVIIGCALMVNPSFLIADEPVSALDVSVQSQILNFMIELKDKFKLTYLFISHDLNVIYYMCDRVAVMYLGKLVEIASVTDIYDSPLHPYTQALISAIPDIGHTSSHERIILSGEVASVRNVPRGCAFHTRCPKAMEICKVSTPQLIDISEDSNSPHFVSCHLIKTKLEKGATLK